MGYISPAQRFSVSLLRHQKQRASGSRIAVDRHQAGALTWKCPPLKRSLSGPPRGVAQADRRLTEQYEDWQRRRLKMALAGVSSRGRIPWAWLRNRRSLRSLRSDRDDRKERGVGLYRFVSLRGHPGKATLTYDQAPPSSWLRAGSSALCLDTKRLLYAGSSAAVDRPDSSIQGRLTVGHWRADNSTASAGSPVMC